MEKLEKSLETLRQFANDYSRIKINNLLSLFNRGNLEECFFSLKKGKAPGADGMTVEEYEKNLQKNIRILARQIRKGKYRPEPMQRFYKRKENGEKRPLSIVSIKDKIVHIGIKKIMEAIYEDEFLDFSYGFRPERNCSQALDRLEDIIMNYPVNFVIDADIKGFFDNVNHRIMIKCLAKRISDKKFLKLIKIILKGGYVEKDEYFPTEKGVPQGAVCSPVMANIFLHYLVDLWIDGIVKRKASGYVGVVRYADDFIILMEKKKEAVNILDALKKNLQKFGLTLSMEKTTFIPFGKNVTESKNGDCTFDFLGFTHFNDRASDGTYRVGKTPIKKN